MHIIKIIAVLLYVSETYEQTDGGQKSAITTHDPEQFINKPKETTEPRRGYGLVKFEDYKDQTLDQNFNNVAFAQNELYLAAENQNAGIQGYGFVKFQDDKTSSQRLGQKKRRKRRKPRFQVPAGYQGSQGSFQGFGQYPYSGYPTGSVKPPRRNPSVAASALSSVTAALTSIALYDDYQCVPRLLCEAAGGGALGTSQLLQSVAGIQPLLTLLSAYSGISTSPLFLFGRAVFLGMTSKGNTGTCHYAYPQCPKDPEQLVHYLNNHNGGFFRFFNAPHLDGQQNLQQFYNQLIGQNYGVHQTNQILNQNGLPHQYGFYKPNLYGDEQGYGLKFPHSDKYGFANQLKLKSNNNDSNTIEKRIQNKPDVAYVNSNIKDIEANSKWIFPVDTNKDDKTRTIFKFPEEEYDEVRSDDTQVNRIPKGFTFPEYQSNHQYVNYYNYYMNKPNNNVNYNNYDNNKNNYEQHNTISNEDDDIEIIYVVRGNGDPNHPERVKLRKGQIIQ